ncbi:hypothetical protein EDC01DRAFT_403098 [Geopyxis carbonaria]|nr:hypothetical protein EDC01DRAFT_403098 [Geopyxis carbonaria]
MGWLADQAKKGWIGRLRKQPPPPPPTTRPPICLPPELVYLREMIMATRSALEKPTELGAWWRRPTSPSNTAVRCTGRHVCERDLPSRQCAAVGVQGFTLVGVRPHCTLDAAQTRLVQRLEKRAVSTAPVPVASQSPSAPVSCWRMDGPLAVDRCLALWWTSSQNTNSTSPHAGFAAQDGNLPNRPPPRRRGAIACCASLVCGGGRDWAWCSGGSPLAWVPVTCWGAARVTSKVYALRPYCDFSNFATSLDCGGTEGHVFWLGYVIRLSGFRGTTAASHWSFRCAYITTPRTAPAPPPPSAPLHTP